MLSAVATIFVEPISVTGMIRTTDSREGAAPYPSESLLETYIADHRIEDAIEVAAQRMRRNPDDAVAQAIHASLLESLTTAPNPPMPQASEAPRYALPLHQAPSTWSRQLARAQSTCVDLLGRARALARLEGDYPVPPVATDAVAWIERLILPNLPPHRLPVARAPQPPGGHIEVDDLGRPAWLMAAQRRLMRDTWQQHQTMRHLQATAASEPASTPWMAEARQMDVRPKIMQDLADLQARAATPPRTTAERWRRAADAQHMIEALTELGDEHAPVFEALAALGSQNALGARLLACAALARGQAQQAIGALTALCANQTDDVASRLMLFHLLVSSHDAFNVDLAHDLFPEGHRQAAAAATHLWGGQGPLPDYLEATLRRLFAANLNALLDFIATIAVAPALKRDLWLATMELHLGSARAGAAQNRQTMQVFDCAICTDEKLPSDDAALVNCACSSKMCLDCAATAVRQVEGSGVIDRCAMTCGNPLTRQDLERLGFAPREVTQRLTRVVRQHLARVADWHHCTTPDCIGGYCVPDLTRFSYTCGLCNEPNRSVTDHDPKLVHNLLAGLMGQGMFRECGNCGVPIEKNLGCNHMTCRCGHEWQFNQHQRKPVHPGLLTKIGFYDRLDDGSSSAVHARAREWFKRYPAVD